MLKSLTVKNKLSISVQLIVTLLAIITSVVLPQILHLFGRLTGTSVMLGTALLPMHLPIIFVGLAAGPLVGAIAGICSPLISFALSGMPTLANLPFMTIELCAYGLVAGTLRKVSLPTIIKVLCTQFVGRVIYVVAMLLFGEMLGNINMDIFSVLESFSLGVIGIMLQLTLIPIGIAYWERM